MLNGYLNNYGKILLDRLPDDARRAWVWAVIEELKKRYPLSDHWTTGGPDKRYIDIRVGTKKRGKKRGNPIFYFRRDASIFVYRSGFKSGNYKELSFESAPDVARISAWFDQHPVTASERELLEGSGYVPSDYSEEEIAGEIASDEEDSDQLVSMRSATDADRGPLNRILYGPPGTGKTFRTVVEALKIIEQTDQPAGDDAVRRLRFNALRREGRIGFVTFHQSYSYEDFIEGIRAETEGGGLSYAVRDGVFKRMAITAMFSAPAKANIAAQPSFADVYRAFLNEVGTKLPYAITSSTGRPLLIQSINDQGTLRVTHDPSIVQHAVGRERMEKLYAAYPTLADLERKGVNDAIIDVIRGANTTAFWAVLKSLLDFKSKNWDDLKSAAAEVLPESEVDYDEKKQHVLGADILEPNDKPYVLIIDEINRGNMSRVFGELITLIESSKRAGKAEAIEVTLPYSGERFSVPANLYIIGTMNTADRSLAVVDTALRRRFDFIEMLPDSTRLKVTHVDGVDVVAMLDKINLRIEHLYDREHTIGHSFFMGLTPVSTISDLATIFRNNILPLLEEYFYEDWEKIGKILGKSGIYEQQPPVDLGFAHNSKVYRRNLRKLESAATYQAIYGQVEPSTAAAVATGNG